MLREARCSTRLLLEGMRRAADSGAPIDLRVDALGFGADRLRELAADVGAATSLAAGACPFADEVDGEAVVSLVGEVVAVKRVTAGAVSYGYTYRIERPTTLALVGLGYADGVPRRASNRVRAAVRGVAGTLAGRVAMDQLVIDLGDATAQPGDEAVLWGGPAASPLGAWAEASGRSPHALLAGLGPRVRRVWTP